MWESIAFYTHSDLKWPHYSFLPQVLSMHFNTTQITHIRSRGETIYRNIAILQYLLLQYNTIWPIENINILRIAIYCNILQYIARYCVFVAD